jgi:membrane-bound serine protease (ClpP class)
MNNKLTRNRLILAVLSTGAEEVAIWVIWRWLLPEFDIYLSVGVLIGVMAAWGAFSVWLFVFTTHALARQKTAGLPSMVGTRGRAASALKPDGMVKIKGELWGAVARQGDIAAGENIRVVGEDGLKLVVERTEASQVKR